MKDLTHTYFEQYLNQTFQVHYGGDTPLTITLANVSTLGQPPAPGEERRHSFALLFQSELQDKYLIQRVYDVEHPEVGTLPLFLVPLGANDTGMQYEAIFT